jgi:hypothetical protein
MLDPGRDLRKLREVEGVDDVVRRDGGAGHRLLGRLAAAALCRLTTTMEGLPEITHWWPSYELGETFLRRERRASPHAPPEPAGSQKKSVERCALVCARSRSTVFLSAREAANDQGAAAGV